MSKPNKKEELRSAMPICAEMMDAIRITWDSDFRVTYANEGNGIEWGERDKRRGTCVVLEVKGK